MTYWVAWKSGNCAYMIADSAITFQRRTHPPRRERSSLGELNYHDTKRGVVVQEGGPKVSALGNALYVFSGNACVGKQIGRGVQRRIVNGESPRRALRQALWGGGPYCAEARAHVAVAFIEEGEPCILEATTDGTCEPSDVYEWTDSGPMPGHIRAEVRRLTEALTEPQLPARQRLLCILAVLQSISVHEYLMESGIGGVYFGLAIGPDGILTAPSQSFVSYDPRLGLRPNCLTAITTGESYIIVKDAASPDLLCMINEISEEHQIAVRQPIGYRYVRSSMDKLATDFVCLVPPNPKRVLVLENMHGSPQPLVDWHVVDKKPKLVLAGALPAVVRGSDGSNQGELVLVRAHEDSSTGVDVHRFPLRFLA